MVVYCNTGSLSAQAVFALRLLGWDNVRVLPDVLEGWKAKGGFEANRRAVAQPRGEGPRPLGYDVLRGTMVPTITARAGGQAESRDDALRSDPNEPRGMKGMQITLDIPEPLAAKLSALPDPQQFVIGLLTQSLAGGLSEDQWWQLLEEIDSVAVDAGVSDLAERHDHYLGAL